MTGRRGSPLERLLAKVEIIGDCWLWTGYIDPHGYGRMSMPGGPRLVHRVAYESLVGPIPGASVLDHICHNGSRCALADRCPHRRCVNPDHLVLSTRCENGRAGNAPSVVIHRSGRCSKGHDRSVHGYARPDRPGSFNCRECRRERRRAHPETDP